jgi:hypothetical protein
MRLARFNEGRIGIVVDEDVIDVTDLVTSLATSGDESAHCKL